LIILIMFGDLGKLNSRRLLAIHPTMKLEDLPFSFVRYCVFKTVAATLHIWRLSPPSAT
jgi:hypothetical protein